MTTFQPTMDLSFSSAAYIQPQTLMFSDNGNLEEEIQNKINIARQETKNLYIQIDKVKLRVQDANLFQMANTIEPLNKSKINLKPTIVLKGHNNKIADFRWSRNSKNILSASQDGFMLIWDSATGMKQNAIPLDSQWVLSCAMSPNGNLVASAGLNNNCTVYKVSKENRVQQNITSIFKGHTCYISDIDFLDNTQVLTASGDMTCALWDIPKAKRVTEYTDHLGDVLALALPTNKNNNNDENIFASCGSDGYTYIWDIRTPGSVQNFFVSNRDVNTLQFFKDGNSIATGSDDGMVNLYDLRSDCPIANYSLSTSLHSQQYDQPTYSEAKMVYSRHSPQSATATAVSSSYLDNQGVVSIDFSNSGRLMYACYTDSGCVVWDTLKAEIVGKLEGHSNRVSRVKTSPDGLAVCTGSWDSTMKIWSPAYM
ncbi:hypothetical protein KAFR_0G01970 [Kazachstania africana CBS 2517]|uniref:Uncharacterized protein n=1 Tax=Kazachstania africana (strain ATCC 22294 / BCRC 22015 / CBS 2517 / CECT 1963 / NBRC 1671 / NRRL Y-8276) TaxID=1071382 RepID=H2AXY1_KAZAF|nr:hypothetical protein KAFR_0G01970 [Kazachstania africana CBS 2517]CCF59231.1 hypothetical protein KAFR_0G01970 [Kazachstania africana CBS 2517]